jgi:hypothetical protein
MAAEEHTRLPRFTRSKADAFVVTERDIEIVRLVYRHRLLRSDQIIALLGEGHSEKKLLTRLQSLFHAHYLDRPRNQLGFVEGGGSRRLLYAPGRSGVLLLAARHEIDPKAAQLRWNDKNRTLKARSFPHMLLVNDIVVSLTKHAREIPSTEIISREVLIAAAPEAQRNRQYPTGWQVRVDGFDDPVGVYPDQMFALRSPGLPDGRSHRYFFVEADTGTLAISRTGKRQTNIIDKVRAYNRSWVVWDKAPELRPFGFSKFRVLFVTSSPQRVKNMLERLEKTFGEEGGGTRFLFTDAGTFQAHPFFAVPWIDGSGATHKIPAV